MRLFLSLHIVLALFIFQRGFLLKRQELRAKSRCEDAKVGTACWIPQQYRRVVFIIIDALRHDFLMSNNVPPSGSNHIGKMPNVAKLIKKNRASVASIIADPPTTTLQRIKAITTGTLPTFIDAGDNFSADAAIQEDSILGQAKDKGMNVTLLGDDTWVSLFPKHFARQVAFDSFDINDLNSVDDAIRPVLADEIKNSDSSLIIAHFLGVDHCGHKYGPNHPVMADTLKKMDDIIGETVRALGRDDLLVVMGDHGMTSTGDHGGDSDAETHAGLLVMSKRQYHNISRTYRQIDIVPTLSLLLGLPIPYSNLGIVMLPLFPKYLHEDVIGMNYEQIKRFAETYAAQNGFATLHEITAHEANSPEHQMNIMLRVQSALRVAWTQFDMSYMRIGIFCLVEAFLFLVTSEKLKIEGMVFRTGLILLQFALLFDRSDSNPAHSLLTMSLSLSCFSSLASLAPLLLTYSPSLSLSSFVNICVVIHSLTFFSNSFVVYEAHVLRYLLQSILLFEFGKQMMVNIDHRTKNWRVSMWRTFTSSLQPKIIVVALIAARCEPYFHRCREEEQNCVQHYPARMFTTLSADAQFWRIIMSGVAMLTFNYFVTRLVPWKTNSLRIVRAMSWPIHGLIIAYSCLQFLPTSSQSLVAHLNVYVAVAVYLLSFVTALIGFYNGFWGVFVIVQSATWPFYLLVGDGLQPGLVCFLFVLLAVALVIPIPTMPSVLSLVVPFGFYLTGHSPTIPSIPWHAAFVGIPGSLALRFLPALLVLSHICLSSILTPLAILLCPSRSTSLFLFRDPIALSTIRAVASCLASTLHRRHLMVWKIFAPRFIFEAILQIAFIVSLNVVLTVKRRLLRDI